MIKDQKTIKSILSETSIIFYKENNTRIWMSFENDKLCVDKPPGYRPVSEVLEIVYDYGIQAWEVIWSRTGEQENSNAYL